jgi:hypothetical protein
MQSEAHRNMAFTLYQAWEMPKVEIDSTWTRSLGNGLTEVTVLVANRRVVPTHTQQDLENKISPPDYVTLTGGNVIAAYQVTNDRTGESVEQRRNPARYELANIPGRGIVRIKWIVRGGGPYTVTVTSQKGGTASARVE